MLWYFPFKLLLKNDYGETLLLFCWHVSLPGYRGFLISLSLVLCCYRTYYYVEFMHEEKLHTGILIMREKFLTWHWHPLKGFHRYDLYAYPSSEDARHCLCYKVFLNLLWSVYPWVSWFSNIWCLDIFWSLCTLFCLLNLGRETEC